MLEARVDLGVAHRQRPPRRPHRPEAVAPPLRCVKHVDVDLRLEHLLHAAHEGVAVLLVGVGERAGAVEARRGIHDLLAVDLAAPAFDLVLRSQRESRRELGRLTHLDILWGRFPGSRKA